ncbi:MAG: hypothetical protein AAF850_04625 [Pseudomonadota bacterium]
METVNEISRSSKTAASIPQRSIAEECASHLAKKRTPIDFLLDTLLFALTLTATIGVVVMIAAATPFAILLSAILGSVPQRNGSTGWRAA